MSKDNGQERKVEMPPVERAAPQGWNCMKQGHFVDPDHPPMGSPVVETTNGYFVYPSGRCLKCGSIFSEKQPLSEEEVEKMKAEAAEQQRRVESGLVGPGGEKLQ